MFLTLSHFSQLAIQALNRNRVQTTLAMLGVTVGVCALVTSMALGRGAQAAIQDQLLAAGINMIVVTSGNYQVERTEAGEAAADHGSLENFIEKMQKLNLQFASVPGNKTNSPTLEQSGFSLQPAVWRPADDQLLNTLKAIYSYDKGELLSNYLQKTHFEDDPMAVHDHPIAKERLGDTMAGLGSAATLTLQDADAIRNMIPGVQFVASGVHENARLTADEEGGQQWFTRLHGTEAELPTIRRGWTFPYGSFLTTRHLENSEQVMVLGQYVAEKLFGSEINPVGRTVLLWNQPFTVIGVIGSSSWASQPQAGDDQFDAIYIPVTTIHRLLNLSKLNTITLTTKSAGETTIVAKAVTELLRERHGISEEMPDDFTVKTQAQQLLGKGLPPDLARVVSGNLGTVETMTIDTLSRSLERANSTMLILLAGVAAVSLLVGGIGVMNLLLLSVSQRTREVGLRMALGARSRDIASQFVLEAMLLSLFGGLLGALIGIVVSIGLESLMQWSTELSVLSMIIAIAVAALLGAISGVYPASRAARLDPIGALHYE